MNLDLTGRLALVSGSTAGIGHAIATALAAEGARVIVNGRTAGRGRCRDRARSSAAPAASVLGFAGDLSTAAAAEALVAAHPRHRDPGQQPRHLRAEAVRGDPRRRLAPLLRGQRAERRAAGAARAAGDEARELGPHRLHLERERGADPGRDDPLRHDEDGAARGRARAGRSRWPAPASPSTASCPVRPDRAASATSSKRSRRPSGKSFEAFEKEFFEKVRPTSLIKRFETPEEVASMVAYVASPLSSGTTGAALRVDGGCLKSAF